MVKPQELLDEMRSFNVNISEELTDLASRSMATNLNNPRFKRLLASWVSGYYDEDPQYVVDEIERVIKTSIIVVR